MDTPDFFSKETGIGALLTFLIYKVWDWFQKSGFPTFVRFRDREFRQKQSFNELKKELDAIRMELTYTRNTLDQSKERHEKIVANLKDNLEDVKNRERESLAAINDITLRYNTIVTRYNSLIDSIDKILSSPKIDNEHIRVFLDLLTPATRMEEE